MSVSDDAAVIELVIAPGSAPGSFRVDLLSSPAGEASAVVELPTGALMARRAKVQAALLAVAASARRSPETERPVRDVGQELFAALLGIGEVAGCYRASAAPAAEQERGLRLSLRTDSPELAGLPWEAMYDQAAGAYICRQEQLVRHIPVPRVPAPFTVSPPLRILGVVSVPQGLAALNVARERDLLTSALAPLVTLGLAEVAWAPSATWDGLHALLLNEAWHVLHFIGHGGFDPDADEGILALTTADGGPDLVEASRFTDLLRQARPMPRLVVLNSCSGATAGTTDLFAGTAAALTRAGVLDLIAE
jgi:CHAT domain